MTEIQKNNLRQIKSYVLRAGRMTKAQQDALLKFKDIYLIQAQDLEIDSNKNTVLEIGFGMGDSLVEMAKNDSKTNFIGMEVHPPGVGAILINIDKYQLNNLKVVQDDINNCLKYIPHNSIDKVQIFFPDPWHKKRHNKRRIIQKEFIDKILTILNKSGIIHIATDIEDYAHHCIDVLSQYQNITNLAKQDIFVARPEFRPITKFEKRGIQKGHQIFDIIFKKK